MDFTLAPKGPAGTCYVRADSPVVGHCRQVSATAHVCACHIRASDNVAAEVRRRTQGRLVSVAFPPPHVVGYGGRRDFVSGPAWYIADNDQKIASHKKPAITGHVDLSFYPNNALPSPQNQIGATPS